MKKVLVVDDYVDYAETVRDFVSVYNKVECIAFSDPLGVIRYVSNKKDVDLIITDYEMPRMNGFELAEKILMSFPNIRIIVSSGRDERYLEAVRKKYNLEGKVEIVSKGNMDFFKTLTT